MQQEEKTLSTVLNANSVSLKEENTTLGPLSRNLAEHLLMLAKKVTEGKITSKKVSAACQCASELHKIMRLNWEMKRNGR